MNQKAHTARCVEVTKRSAIAHSDPRVSHHDYVSIQGALGFLIADEHGNPCFERGERRLRLLEWILRGGKR